jgi:DNA-binding CsgD family transcriptional regulator
MSKTRTLRMKDVRCAFRLIGECRELRRDAEMWRRHAFEDLARLLNARAANGGSIQWQRPDGIIQFTHSVVTGFSAADIAVFARFMRERDPAGDPIFNALGRLPGKAVTRTRQQLVRDHDWYDSVSFNGYRRVVGVDHCMYSLHAVGGSNAYSLIGLHRPLAENPFSSRERQLFHLVHMELAALMGRELACESRLAGLSPRLRQTLQCLLQGDSEKQIAARLCLSQPTVHQYVTALHRHFGVSSRGELLAHFIVCPTLMPEN